MAINCQLLGCEEHRQEAVQVDTQISGRRDWIDGKTDRAQKMVHSVKDMLSLLFFMGFSGRDAFLALRRNIGY